MLGFDFRRTIVLTLHCNAREMAAYSSGRHSPARGEEEGQSWFTSQPYNDVLGILIGFYTRTLAHVHTPSPVAHLP